MGPESFFAITNWFWLLMIVGTLFNAGMFWIRSSHYRTQHPSLRPGHFKIIRTIAIFGNIPWVILGLGTINGNIKSIFDVLILEAANIYIIAFYLSVVMLGLAYNYFVFFRSGSAFLTAHLGLMSGVYGKIPGIWKLLGILILIAHAGFFAGLYFISTHDIP